MQSTDQTKDTCFQDCACSDWSVKDTSRPHLRLFTLTSYKLCVKNVLFTPEVQCTKKQLHRLLDS